MTGLPDRLPVLDQTMRKVEDFVRLTSKDRALSESDYDNLISDHYEMLESVLKESEVMDPLSRLEFLGKYVLNVDVLFGEFRNDELVRLVLVEDKLLKNPESKRVVIAQVLDYARQFAGLDAEELMDALDSEGYKLVKDCLPDLGRILETEDFLLLICGDEIHPSVVDLASRLVSRRNDPRSRVELTMVSLKLYKNTSSGHFLLVPRLAGTVLHRERDLVVKVKVVGSNNEALKAVTTTEWSRASPTEEDRQPVENYFATLWPQGSSEVQSRWKAFVDLVWNRSDIPLEQDQSPKGRPAIYLLRENAGRVHLLNAGRYKDELTLMTEFDHYTHVYPKGSAGRNAMERFCGALLNYDGAERRKQGIVKVPIESVVAKPGIFVEAVQTLLSDLKNP